MSLTTEERFWAKVNKDGPTQPHMATPCWVWTGVPHQLGGYGRLSVSGRPRYAHHLSWEMAHGNRGSASVLHRCDNGVCIRPDHLFLGTQADNVADMISKGRDRRPRGDQSGARKHPESQVRGDAAWNAKLTPDAVRAIRAAYALGESGAALGRRFGVSGVVALHVAKGLRWRHVQ